jgi:hypothetical protein
MARKPFSFHACRDAFCFRINVIADSIYFTSRKEIPKYQATLKRGIYLPFSGNLNGRIGTIYYF